MPVDGLRLEEISFRFDTAPTLAGVSLKVPAGAFVSILGPSGCGKTTLVKIVAGYLKPLAGRVLLHGTDITNAPPGKRNTGMVFQNLALFPHQSARGNVAFGLEARGLPSSEIHQRVEAMLDQVGLKPDERNRQPGNLSGGQQQRVALGRALVIQPSLLMLDEPLSNLDSHLRDQMRGLIRQVQRDTGVTTMMVTHDPEEAMAMSDLIAVMNQGTIVEVGTGRDLYQRPRSAFVARFLGLANIVDGSVIGHRPGSSLLVRPECLVINGEGVPFAGIGKVINSEFFGADVLVTVALGNTQVLVRGRPNIMPQPGTEVRVSAMPGTIHELPADGES